MKCFPVKWEGPLPMTHIKPVVETEVELGPSPQPLDVSGAGDPSLNPSCYHIVFSLGWRGVTVSFTVRG